MSKLEEVSKLLCDYRKTNRRNPSLIVMGAKSFNDIRDMQQSGFVKLWCDHETNGYTFDGVRVLISNETDYNEISFY